MIKWLAHVKLNGNRPPAPSTITILNYQADSFTEGAKRNLPMRLPSKIAQQREWAEIGKRNV